MISQEYISALVIVLAQILPAMGVTLGTADLTSLIGAVVTLIAGVWIMIRRYSKKDINIAGFKKLG